MYSKHFYVFGEYRLDGARMALWRQEELIALPPKPLEVLLVLVRNCGEVVDRDTLMQLVWPDTFVEPNNLTQCISQLRKTLENGAEGKFIETVPKRGYRFAGTLTEQFVNSGPPAEPEPLPAASPAAPPIETATPIPAAIPVELSARRAAPFNPLQFAGSMGLLVVLTILVLLVTTRFESRGARTPQTGLPPPTVHRIGVAPTTTLRTQTHPPLNLTESLLNRLNREPTLTATVAPARSAPAGASLTGTAGNLGMEGILETAFEQLSASEVRIHVKLSTVETGTMLWETQFTEFTSTEHYADRLVVRIGDGLITFFARFEKQKRDGVYSSNLAAVEAYERGRLLWRLRTGKGLLESISLYQQAINQDPQFAAAYIGLAQSYMFDLAHQHEAEAMARKAAELAPSSAEPHAALGFIKLFHDWDWKAAEEAFQKAIRLDPTCANAHQWYGTHLMTAGRMDEARVQLEEAHRLDVTAPSINTDLAYFWFVNNSNEKAVAECEKVLDTYPEFPSANQCQFEVYMLQGDYPKAVASSLRFRQTSNDNAAPLQQQRLELFQKEGIIGYLQKELKQGRQSSFSYTYGLAQKAMWVGDQELALEWLEKAHQEHNFYTIYIVCDPAFRSLHSDPRFLALVRQIGVPNSWAWKVKF